MLPTAGEAGLQPVYGCHTLRATGITTFRRNGGTIEKARQIAAHASVSTTKLYDQSEDEVTLDDIAKMVF